MALSLQSKYQANRPFPNIVIDEIFETSTYKKILKTFPKEDDNIWKKPTNKHTVGKSVTKQGDFFLKESLFDEPQRRVFMEFSSSLFLRFVEVLTGIEGLVADPYFAEGSYAMSSRGGFLDTHADFSHHDKLGLERRVNLIFYLNDEWSESYGGDLRFFSTDLKPVKSVFPLGNRMVLFTTSDISYHGFPDKLDCPENVHRKSINLYYYTIPRKSREKRRIRFSSDPTFKPVISQE